MRFSPDRRLGMLIAVLVEQPAANRVRLFNAIVFDSRFPTLRFFSTDKALLLGDLLSHVDRDVPKAFELAGETTPVDEIPRTDESQFFGTGWKHVVLPFHDPHSALGATRYPFADRLDVNVMILGHVQNALPWLDLEFNILRDESDFHSRPTTMSFANFFLPTLTTTSSPAWKSKRTRNFEIFSPPISTALP